MLLRALALLVPPACVHCREPVAHPADALCPACRADLPWLVEPCPRCALPLPHRRCPAARAPFAAAWAPVTHAGPARSLVVALKFRGDLRAADAMAAQIAANAPRGLLDAPAAIVPVPMPAARRRRRGADHTARLAAALAKRTGLPARRCLVRGAAPRQVGRGRAERAEQAALSLRASADAPAAAILVDDVHTTGATLRACAAALSARGSRRIVAVTYARAP